MILVNPKLNRNLNFNDFDFESKYGFDRVLKKESAIRLVNYFKDIQRNNFYSDMPEFNMTQISTESFVYVQCSGQDFISRLFSKSDEGLYWLTQIVNELGSEPEKTFK